MSEAIREFRGEYRWLSNFWKTVLMFDGMIYPTSEHAYQAAKTLDKDERHRIANLPSPGDAKRAGKALRLRSDWEKVKVEIMRLILKAKFDGNAVLRRKLVETGDRLLEEGNTWGDTFWGVCRGKGQNMLGKLLMELRGKYQKGREDD